MQSRLILRTTSIAYANVELPMVLDRVREIRLHTIKQMQTVLCRDKDTFGLLLDLTEREQQLLRQFLRLSPQKQKQHNCHAFILYLKGYRLTGDTNTFLPRSEGHVPLAYGSDVSRTCRGGEIIEIRNRKKNLHSALYVGHGLFMSTFRNENIIFFSTLEELLDIYRTLNGTASKVRWRV